MLLDLLEFIKMHWNRAPLPVNYYFIILESTTAKETYKELIPQIHGG